MKAGFKDINDEADDLIEKLQHFSLDSELGIDFSGRMREIHFV